MGIFRLLWDQIVKTILFRLVLHTNFYMLLWGSLRDYFFGFDECVELCRDLSGLFCLFRRMFVISFSGN